MGERVARTQLLQEAKALEELGGEWTIAHVAAFCTVSVSFIARSDCPRIEKEGVTGTKGKTMPRYLPSVVREWNAKRNKKVA